MDVNRYFNDDFSHIFNDSDMNMDEDDIEHFINLLGVENTLEVRYENICNVVYKFLHKTELMEVEEKILQYLMPAIRQLFTNIFQEISNRLQTSEAQSSDACTIKALRDCILMCLGSYEVLDCILKNVLQNELINFCYIQSVPVDLLNILLLTFQHCKESENMYSNYFNELKEILQLFKSAQDIHSKLLQLLLSHIKFNFEDNQEIVLLKEVLLILGEIGEVLVDVNVKTSVDNWRGYMALIEKYSGALNQNGFSINKPLGFIMQLIKQNLENVLKMNATEQKSYYHTLKMCNFFVKIVIRLYDIFWQQRIKIYSQILTFFSSIYRFYSPYLYFKGYNDGIISGIELLVIKSCDSLLDKCLLESEFYKAFNGIDLKDNLNSAGLLFFILDIFWKLSSEDYKEINTTEVDVLIDNFFRIISESYVELFWSIHSTSSSEKRMLFEEGCMNITKVVLQFDLEHFHKTETILMKNILQENLWNALFALEIWRLVLRCQGPELTYKTILNIITITSVILEDRFTYRPQKVFIKHLLHQLYISLPEIHRVKLIEKYSVSSHLQLWHCFTFNEFPLNYMVFIESLLISVTEKVEEFKNGKCYVPDFYFLCDAFDAVASLPATLPLDTKHLIVTVLKLWNFDVNPGYIQSSSLLKCFIKKLFNVTSSFVTNLTGEQLLLVLTRVKELSSTGFQIEIMHMLKQLSQKCFNQMSEQNQILTLLSSIFSTLCVELNPIIKQIFLETFIHFLNTTPHEEVLQNVVKSNHELQYEVSSFIQKLVINRRGKQVLSGDDYFTKQKHYKFQHKCPNFLQAPKTTNKDEADLKVLVKRIKCDLEVLFKMSDKKYVENTVTEIVSSFN